MSRLSRSASYLIYSLNALLIFLWFYKNQINVPTWLQTFGRMHPMILHLPIGFFVMAVAIILFRKQFKPRAFKKSLKLILTFTALTLVITALAGIILSREGGYNSETLKGHVNSGVILSVVTAVLASSLIKKKLSITQYSLVGIGFVALVITGHYGSTLTHGENYLFGRNELSEIAEDSITIFTKAILPVLENKCGSCHNENKKKGELVLVSQAGILKGGENGSVINTNSPNDSEILKRIHLEINHDDHMPPSGKSQLTFNELELISLWINRGPDFTTLWKSIAEKDSITILAQPIIASYNKSNTRDYNFDFASNDEVESLNTPFRTVSQISTNEPALKTSFYLAQYFKSSDLDQLSAIKSQLIDLNLAGMPIGDNEIDKIVDFENLESLNLNNTAITDQGILQLKKLSKLVKLSLVGTKITSRCLQILIGLKSIREIYIWNTSIQNSEVDKVRKANKNISWNIGYQPKENEVLKLTPPILVSSSFLLEPGDKISLKHNLPGTTIRITLDGTEPDSVHSTIYKEPLTIQDHLILKTLATKDGWLKSNTLEYNFYLAGIMPIKTELLTITSKNYKAKGAESLIDNQLGDSDNFRDGNWLGFRENKMIAQFHFGENNKPHKLTMIYNKNIGSYLMPPESVEVWGGNNNSSLKLLKIIKPDQPKKYQPVKTESISCIINQPQSIIKIIATPVQKLPAWHSGKGEKGWFMVSEIIFR